MNIEINNIVNTVSECHIASEVGVGFKKEIKIVSMLKFNEIVSEYVVIESMIENSRINHYINYKGTDLQQAIEVYNGI
jgi:hypothetical protein